jgi:hypothetical protein
MLYLAASLRRRGKCAGNDLGRCRRQALAGEQRLDAKAGEPNATGFVDKCVRRLDVFMDEAPLLDCTKNDVVRTERIRLHLTTF